MRKLAARLLRWLAEVAVRFYYPRRSVEGLANVPAGGGALYVANHPNGLLDPLVLRVVIRRRVRFLAKSTLWGNPFGRLAMDAFECLPVYRQRDVGGGGRSAFVSRNEETFARCRAELAAGGDLALYPEGTSHADPQLKPLKTGAARIALGAAAEASATPEGRMPRLIPVGSRYENQALFRSGVHLVVGEAIDLRPYLATYSAVTGAEPNQAIADLTDAIRARLDVLVLQAETRELLEGVARVASWTGMGPGDDAPERLHARTRELLVAYAKLRSSDPERVERIAEQARAYARMLEKMGIRDPWALETPHLPLGRIAVTFARTLVLAPAVPWGLVTSWFPYRLAGFAARRATKDEDVLSTMKMIGGAAFLVAAWLIEAVVIGLLGGVGLGVLSLLVAPAAGYAALRFGEHVRATAEALRHLGWRTQGKTARHLAARRKRLAEDVAHALRQVGP
jgi:glycerol-3-phosphate O-acyltransferase/dihydroxyacetone phosphate acyltransferase